MKRQSRAQEISRREFLRNLSIAGISGLVLPRTILAGNRLLASRVVIVDDAAATSGTSINGSVVQTMIASGIRSLGQQSDVGEAWKTLLPGISSASRIAIKVNCINSSLSTHPVVANAVANSLCLMQFSGTPFPANNIIIFDRTNGELQGAGYTLNTSASGVRCFGTNSSGVGYASQTYDVAGVSQRLSRILTDMADYLINLAVLKNHGDAGVTLCLKNHYGTCNSPGSLPHGGGCDPYIPALTALTPIRTKQMVNIIDALYGIKSGGPGGPPAFSPKTFIMSTDVVAADYWGRQLLTDNGCTTTSYASHVDTAATQYALGTNVPGQMDVVRLHNPSTTSVDPRELPVETALHQNYPNPFNPHTTIRFTLGRDSMVRVRVVDTTGRVVTTLIDAPLPAGEHTAFLDGSSLASGTYLCELRANDALFAIKMSLIK